MHRHDDRRATRLLDHVRVAVVEHVHQIGALGLALDAPRIEVVAGRPLLRAVQRAGQHDARRIDRLGPPADERFATIAALFALLTVGRGAAADGVSGESADVCREANLKAELAALQPIMETVSVLIHRRPAL